MIISDEILRIIARGESETVEFKKSTSVMREAVETVCAFANREGGYLFFGVEDDGSIPGLHVSDDTLRYIANEIKLNTDPKIYPSIERIYPEGKTCILVTVEESPLKPHLAFGMPCLRVGSTNQKIGREQYEHLLRQRLNGYGFDHQVQEKAGIEDMDTDSVYRFLEIANTVRSLNENMFLPPETVLEKLDLTRNGKPTNAALLLFGKDPSKYFPGHYEVKCGIFPEDSGYDTVFNDKEFRQNLLAVFDDALNYVLGAIKKNTRKTGVRRTEEYEFPPSVVREALVNAIVHRDYRQDVKSTIEIRLSRLTICNPAQLFGPIITVERLKQFHPSRPGNRLIAKIFYLMGLFENWGGGTLKIVSDTVRSGKKEPEFVYEDGMFWVVLYRK